MRPELQILCCSHSPPSGKGVYFRSESLRWYKITFPKAFSAPERDMICILLWYLAVKPALRNEFVLLITNCSGERHEGLGGGGIFVPQQKQCTEQLLFLIITIKADKQAANADFSELRAQKQTASVDHTSHRGPCWDEGDYSATASQSESCVRVRFSFWFVTPTLLAAVVFERQALLIQRWLRIFTFYMNAPLHIYTFLSHTSKTKLCPEMFFRDGGLFM